MAANQKGGKRRRTGRATIDESARDTAEIVALLRELREKMALVEELEPDNTMLRDYQYFRGWAIVELRRIRAAVELQLYRRGVRALEKTVVRDTLDLITLVESELQSRVEVAH